MPARLLALKRYQRPRQSGSFADLPPDQRARAEAHYQRLCARWGDDLPPWRRAILTGRAKDLVVRPRDATWAYAMRRRQNRQPTLSAVIQQPTSQPSQPTTVGSRSVPDSVPLVPGPPVLQPSVASSLAPTDMASHPPVTEPPPPLAPSPIAQVPPAALRLDLQGVTVSGTDGHDTAQRILRDLDHALGRTVRFSMAVPAKDLPSRWTWRLELVPVP